ncbi:sigma-54-dependent Fis family transcriptional regulator [bacterium]|nr:sigma-54-dependent Fis family transcriptional regulator [bacterium]
MKYHNDTVLLIDDEEQFLLGATFALNSDGIRDVIQCSDSREVMSILSGQRISVIALDMTMPHISGLELLPGIVRHYPDIPVIVITAINEVETAVQCMKEGAFDYMVKPIDDARLISGIRRGLELSQMRGENTRLKETLLSGKLEHPEAFTHIITQSPSMKSIFQYIEAVAPTPLPILITGETGTGKELIARAVHTLSSRPGEFVAVNVAGVDDQLFSDTLFGHRKGAFTGADQDRKGLIEQASGGTLFLDEIGDLSPESQVKLLRLLQEGQYHPLGSDVPKLSNARIVVATHRDIDDMQASERFRKDLFYRLKTHLIHLPPLRDRREDIGLLASYYLKKAAAELKKAAPTPPRELFTLLKTYHFPGNVRELEGLIYNAVSLHKSGVLSLDPIREQILPRQTEEVMLSDHEELRIAFSDTLPTLKDMEQALIEEALSRADGNQTIAAQMLGLTRRALNNRLQRSRDR